MLLRFTPGVKSKEVHIHPHCLLKNAKASVFGQHEWKDQKGKAKGINSIYSIYSCLHRSSAKKAWSKLVW